MDSKKLKPKEAEFIGSLNISDKHKSKLANSVSRLSDRMAAIDRQSHMKERARALYSWQSYAQKNPKMAEREEKFRLSLRPTPLSPLSGTDEKSMETLRDTLKIEDLTLKYRNAMKAFSPMRDLDKKTPKPLIDNLMMIDTILTSSSKKGAYATAKPGSGKTTVFSDLLPVMAAELALNWKNVWWTAPEGTEFNKSNLMRFPIREKRILFGSNPKALSGYGKGSLAGDAANAYDNLRAVIENNPDEVYLVLDEIFDALGKQDTSVSGGGNSTQAFLTFLKTTNSGGGTGAYKYKFFGLFASENKKNFLDRGEDSYYDAQMRQRLDFVDFKELPWDEKIVTPWLKSAIGYFGKEASYSPPAMGYLTSEVRQKLMQNNNEVMTLIVAKAYAAFYNAKMSADDVRQPSVQRSVSSTVGAIFETYDFRIRNNPDYLEVKKLLDKRNVLKNELGRIKKEITETDVELKTLSPDQAKPQGQPQSSQQKSQPAAKPNIDEISSEFSDVQLSSRDDEGLNDQDRQIIGLGDVNKRQELESYSNELLDMQKTIITQLTSVNKKAMEISKRIVQEMAKPKHDDLLNETIDGDFVADDLSDFEYLKKSDVTETEKSLIVKTDEERLRRTKTVEFTTQTEFPGHDEDEK